MSDGFAYVGIAECGCMRAATVDDPERRNEVRKDVSSFMRWGARIERAPVEAVRVRLCMAKHGKKDNECPHPNDCPEMKKPYTVTPPERRA